MKSVDLMEAIGDVQSAYIQSVQQDRNRGTATTKRNWSKARVLLIAAAAAVLLVGCAYAVAKLEALRLPMEMKSRNPEDNGVVSFMDTISMQGYSGSPEYQAAQEWNAFEKIYDPDFALMDQADANQYQPPDAYSAYLCYTPEMIEKINEICEKYNLRLMGKFYPVYGPEEELFPSLGIHGVHRDDADARIEMDSGCYYYGSGSFTLSGNTCLPGLEPINYQFICNQKNTFSVTSLNLADIEAFTQWEYVMKDGTRVLLGLNGDRAVILADLADAFVTVNILQGAGLTVSLLENFADTFDLTFHVTPPDPPAELVHETQSIEYAQDRPETTDLEFWGEGMAYPEPATLHRGEGYSIYIPDVGWRFSQTQRDGAWADKWVSEYNDAVEIMVTLYPGATVEDFRTAITPAPITATEYGFWAMDRVGDENELVRLYPEARGIYALFIRYPREAGEGFSVQMATIANTFEAAL